MTTPARPFRFDASRATPATSRPALCAPDGRRFKVLLPSRAPAQLSLFALNAADKESRAR